MNLFDVDHLDGFSVQHAPAGDAGSHQPIGEALIGCQRRATELVFQAAVFPRRDLFEPVVFALHRWTVRVCRVGDPHPDLLPFNRYAGASLTGIPTALLFGQAVEPAVTLTVGAVRGPVRIVGVRLPPCRLTRHLLPSPHSAARRR